MIKTKKCILCDSPAFSKGLCKIHTKNKSIKQKTEKTSQEKEIQKEVRDIYFEYHINRCIHSEHSNISINEPNRSNICHLIDKGRHKSLEDNLDNCIYLTYSEHERFDKLLFSLEFDKLEKEFKNTWYLACTRIKLLIPLCKENTVFTRAIQKYLDGREIKS